MKRSRPVATSWRALALAALAPLGAPSMAAQEADSTPRHVFLQLGVGEGTSMAVVGATWNWSWRKEFASGHATGYWEVSAGRWHTDGDGAAESSTAWVTQAGITPVVRFHPRAWGDRWFLEGGIGANVVVPIFRTRDKRFSTAFNFGDHVAVGTRFGHAGDHELSLRLQHFSNAGIRHPNPGENFVQLRYAKRY